MDAGFYSADYLRAWIRSAQLSTYLRREVGDDWWRSADTGEILRGAVRRGHAAFDSGHRAPARLRPARHRPARRRAERLAPDHTRHHRQEHLLVPRAPHVGADEPVELHRDEQHDGEDVEGGREEEEHPEAADRGAEGRDRAAACA